MACPINTSITLRSFDTHIEIQFPDTNTKLKLYYIWLRDHCRCVQCYNINTNQIFSDVLNISVNIAPLKCEIVTDNLKITWKDDHETVFSLDWLQKLQHPKQNTKDIVLWDGTSVLNFDDTKITVTDFFKDQDGLKWLLTSLKKYGFGIVTNVEQTLEATRKVAEHIGLVKNTLFGEMWYVTEDQEHKDTAYTKIALAAHNDNTYFSDASGLQIFHLLETDGIGGESILVDGFNAAHILKDTKPAYYKFLCNTSLQSQYIETGYHYYNIDSVIKLHPITKSPFQIRYNIYDRSPLTLLPEEDVLKFYESYQHFGSILNDPKNEFRIALTPGTVLIFDNWRLLHGRTAYKGKRELTGCYISRDDWLSKAKTLGINII